MPPLDIASLFSIDGKVAMVTGASSGIGRHLANTFAAAGAKVALAARRGDRLAAAVAEIEQAGGRAVAVSLDVTRSSTIEPAFDAAEQALGGPVGILINNSGVLYMKKFLDQEESEIARILDTNLKGAFLVAQAAARRMCAVGDGSIINVGSSAGLRAGGLMSSYGASKAGLLHLTRIMALELAPKGVRVNALAPGNIDTAMSDSFESIGIAEHVVKRIPQRRFGRPEDLDGAALLLASDAGRYITGAVIAVDGGQILSWM